MEILGSLSVMRVETVKVESFAALGCDWRELEARLPAPGFFQSWSWVGCLAEERFPDPVLLRAHRGGVIVGLALFNRARGRLCLTESGDRLLDAPFIEHNAPLCGEPAVAGALLQAAWQIPDARSLGLGGVAPVLLSLAGGVSWRRQDRAAPFLDLDALRATGGDYLSSRSANSRQQIRRSLRHYAALGEVRLERAADAAQARAWFDRMLPLHAATWQARGQVGAFATDFMRRFHHALIARAAPRGEVDMLRCTAGEAEIGLLYNLRRDGVVHAYQSGFDMRLAAPHGQPGLTCHSLAVQQGLERGDTRYDFMAGVSRYKNSLAGDSQTLAWAEHVPVGSPRAWVARWRRWLGRG